MTPQELPVTESSGEKLSALHNHAVSRPLGRLIAHCLNVIAVRIQHKRGIVLTVIGSIARATVRLAASLGRHLVEWCYVLLSLSLEREMNTADVVGRLVDVNLVNCEMITTVLKWEPQRDACRRIEPSARVKAATLKCR